MENNNLKALIDTLVGLQVTGLELAQNRLSTIIGAIKEGVPSADAIRDFEETAARLTAAIDSTRKTIKSIVGWFYPLLHSALAIKRLWLSQVTPYVLR